MFAPSNEAFNRTAKLLGGEDKLEELIKSQKDAPKILGLHLIDEQIPSNDIRITKPQNFVTCKTCKTKVIDSRSIFSLFSISDRNSSLLKIGTGYIYALD